jgi:hypothetical protein
MDQGLQRVLNLAKKTGDNVIVFDSLKPERSYVILAINKYEDLLEEAGYQDFLTEEEMTDKINRDIEPWDDNDWNPEDFESNDFLPKNLFEEDDDEAAFADSSGESKEDEWEEDINYLYPTEDEFTSLRTDNSSEPDLKEDGPAAYVEDYGEPKEETAFTENLDELITDEEEPAQNNPGFSSIGDLLEEKKTKGNVWEIPEERQA